MTQAVQAGLTMPELIGERAGGDTGRTALCVDGVRSMTYGQWLSRARPVANGLAGLGARPGASVALVFHDWLDYAVGAMAVYLSGAAVVGISPRLGTDEMLRRLQRCGVGGLLHGPGVAVPGFGGWSVTLAEAASMSDGHRGETAARPEDIAEIIYTSGTTGPAKPVAVPQANLTFGHAGGGRLPGAAPSVLAPVRPGTNAGHSAILVALVGGSTVHVLTDPAPQPVADALGGLGIEMAILPAPLATRLVVTGLLDRQDLSRLRAVMLGSTPTPTATVRGLRTLLAQAAISIGYGSTEAAPASTHLAIETGTEPPGAVGQPRPGVAVEIRDFAGVAVACGDVGEIWLRSSAPSRSYHGVADSTFHAGWTRMGDLGFLDPKGGLHFYDRTADAIVHEGRRISAFRVEDALHWHPDVADAAVVLVPDGRAGRLVAAVELMNPVGAVELKSFLADRLDDHEIPSLIVPVDELPRGGLNKVLKRRLRESLAAAHDPAGSALPLTHAEGLRLRTANPAA